MHVRQLLHCLLQKGGHYLKEDIKNGDFLLWGWFRNMNHSKRWLEGDTFAFRDVVCMRIIRNSGES